MSNQRRVQDFHEKMGFIVKANLSDLSDEDCLTLKNAGNALIGISKMLRQLAKVQTPEGQTRAYTTGVGVPIGSIRAHLQVEELGEQLLAMSNRDATDTLDAIADLQYVLLGTAVAFDLPLQEAFEEVHRSNMTKEKPNQRDTTIDVLHPKGASYQPPNLRKILSDHWWRPGVDQDPNPGGD